MVSFIAVNNDQQFYSYYGSSESNGLSHHEVVLSGSPRPSGILSDIAVLNRFALYTAMIRWLVQQSLYVT